MLNPSDKSCPFCNGVQLRHYVAPAHDVENETVSIVECRNCEAGWQWPLRRSEQQSAAVFENAYAQHNDGSYFDISKRDSVANCQVDFILKKRTQPGRLLDIGCGDGNFARHMAQRGWDVTGLDPALSKGTVEQVDNGRLSLQSHGLVELPAGQLFDVITLWDVVEHVEKPDQLIQAAVAYLAPGGLLIAETGNFQSAGRIDSQGTWWNFQLDHRWYFAPPQLEAMMAQAGLDGIELDDKVLRPWWKGQRDMPRPRLRSVVKAVVKKPWQISTILRRHNDLLSGQKNWAGWSGLDIMTMTGRKGAPPADAR
jgi:2-polyprenyl-3-methyl-5-hydroxy-6-metoxy-1,4-benzoquinol methylase